MIRIGILLLTAAASLPAVARADTIPVVRRGEVVAGAVVRVPARATQAASHPLRDDGRVRGAIAACVAEAERRAPGSGADVLDVDSVVVDARGHAVSGRVAVNRLGHTERPGGRAYGRGWHGDFRGWTPALRGYDVLRFACRHGKRATTVSFM